MMFAAPLRRLRARLRPGLRDCESGVALVEFALSAPLLMFMFLGGAEVAHNVLARKKVSEIAVMVADNASRMGDDTVLRNKPISEAEINELFLGAQLSSGGLDIRSNGRIVLSSLEQNSDHGQWIHWQRCYGTASYTPDYPEGTGATGTSLDGLGPTGNKVQATEGDAVMVVTIVYDYVPMVPAAFAGYSNQRFTARAAMNVRDDRDLSGVQPSSGVTSSTC